MSSSIKEIEPSPEKVIPVVEDDALEKKKKTRSLRLLIGLFYMTLALFNIIFFSVMIFENQTDLLNRNILYKNNELGQRLVTKLGEFGELQQDKLDYKKFREFLLTLKKDYNYTDFYVFDRIKGEIISQYHTDENQPEREIVPSKIKRKADEMSASRLSAFERKFEFITNAQSFKIDLVVPLEGKAVENKSLWMPIHNVQVQQSLNDLYIQILYAVFWGAIFHIGFGIFVYRIIFRRVALLTVASNRMAEGDLKARADWKMKRTDELDVLGDSFNTMAFKIEEHIGTITKLNTEIQNELEIGKEVQELFLPSKKILKEYKPAVYYRPLREVSGDIYNFFKFKNGLKGVFLADASGHGPSAALITCITLISLDESLSKSIQPNTVVEYLNNTMTERLQSSFFATAVFAVLMPDNTMLFTNAGHNPPLYFRPSTGQISELPKCGPPLGMFEDIEYKTFKLKGKPGDRVVLYTDSMVEGKHKNGEMYGMDRLKALLTENMQLPNKELVDLLSSSLDDFTHHYTDDVTIIVLEYPE